MNATRIDPGRPCSWRPRPAGPFCTAAEMAAVRQLQHDLAIEILKFQEQAKTEGTAP